MRNAICSGGTRAAALRLCPVSLRFITLIIVVFVDIYVASSWLMVLRTGGFFCRCWCFRHPGQ